MPDQHSNQISATVEIDVPFFDVDSCDVVWHGHYVKYFEIARCKLLDELGYNYQTMREDGFFFPVIKMQIKYIKPLVFAQVCLVTATLIEWENRLKITYSVRDKSNDEELTRADTIQAAVDMRTQEMQFISPEKLIHCVQKYTA